jgi:hypothetical protein
LGEGGLNQFFSKLGFGENFDFVTTFFGKNGFSFEDLGEVELADAFGEFAKSTLGITEG